MGKLSSPQPKTTPFWLCILAGLMVVNFVFAAEKIDINTAPLEDLVKIIHIGEIRARELISLRPFSFLDELTKIKGIGEAKLRDIKEQNLAWIAPQSQPGFQQPLQQPIIYPSGIVINEILPSAEGSDEKEEWIEIFNQNDFEVDLSGWQIVDTIGETKTYTFPEETKISPQGFLILPRPIAKITLNNDGDGLNLIQPDGKTIDAVNYEKAPRGQSYNRTGEGWLWSSVLTPDSANIIPILAPEIKGIKPVEEKKEQKKELKEPEGIISEEKKLATVSQPIIEGNSESALTFLISLSLSVLSGTIILVVKIKLRNNKNLLE